MDSQQTSPDLTVDAPAIRIRDNAVCARIEPATLELVTEVFVERRRFGADVRGVMRASDPEHLFEIDADGAMHVPSGLVPRLADAARRAGSRVEIQDRAEPPIPASAPDVTDLDEDGRRLVAALAGNRRGVIQVRSPGEQMAAIELALRVFATGRFMIVTKTRSEARKITEALRAGREEPVACYTRQCTTSDVRIQVGTAGGLDLTYASIVLFTDATQVLHERGRTQLLILRRQRIYALHGDGSGLSRRERLLIEGYVGPVIGSLGPTDDPAVDVRAVFGDWSGNDRPDEPMGLEWKRCSIWSNSARNGALARLAAALAAGDMATLWEHGVFCDDEPAVGELGARRVAVLVESPEHARALGRLLPGWGVVCADGADLDTGGRADAAGVDTGECDDLPGRAIVTWLHARRRGRIEADVVVRADGLPWPLDLPVAPPRPGPAGVRPVLLVDLADHQDRTARDATRARRLDYRDRGWIAP